MTRLATCVLAVLCFGLAAGSVSGSNKSAPCVQCGTPSAECCYPSTFCCGWEVCCYIGQICGEFGCINMTSMPPLPPGPPHLGELLWADFVPGFAPEDPLVFDVPDVGAPSKQIVVTGPNVTGYDIATGHVVWSATFDGVPEAYVLSQIAYVNASTRRQDVITYFGPPVGWSYISSVAAKNGKLNWIVTLNNSLSCQTLLVAEGILLLTDIGLRGIDVETGSLVWQTSPTIAMSPLMWCFSVSSSSSSTAASAGRDHQHAPDHFMAVDTYGSIITVRAKTGKVEWHDHRANITTSNGLCAGRDTLVASFLDFSNGGDLMGYPVNQDGRSSWRYHFGYQLAPPIVFGNVAYVVEGSSPSGLNPTITSIDASTGAVRWSWPVVNELGANASVVFGYTLDGGATDIALISDGLLAFAVRNGRLLFNVTSLMLQLVAPPVLSHDVLYLSIGLTAGLGLAVAVDAKNGTVYWERPTQFYVSGIVASTVDGKKTSVAVVTSDEQYIYGVANS